MAETHGWHHDEATGQYIHRASVFVNAPVETCFNAWANFTSFPRLLRHVNTVTQVDNNTWHWEATVAGIHEDWDAVTSEFVPNKAIAWQSTRGLKNSGRVTFTPQDNGCLITVELLYDPPFGFIGDIVARNRVNDQFQAHLQQDLDDFKHNVESGGTQQSERAA